MEWDILSSLSADEKREFLALASRRTFARSEVVFHRGDPADTLHLVSAGRFAVRVVTPLGDVATLAVVGPGGFFGELALLDQVGRRTATVAALERSETRSIVKAAFDALCTRHPAVAGVVTVALADRVRSLSERLVEALYVPAETRVLRRLRSLGRDYGAEGKVTLPLTQAQIASFCGTSRATVNQVLREAERRGEIIRRRGHIVLIDPAAIERRAR